MKCRSCGAELANDAKFCRECGAKVMPQKRFCRECGAQLADGVKFCSECGAKVDFKSETIRPEPIVKPASVSDSHPDEDHVIRGEYTYTPQDTGKKSSISSKIDKLKSMAENPEEYQEKITKKVSEYKDTIQGATLGGMAGMTGSFGKKQKKKSSPKLLVILGALVIIFALIAMIGGGGSKNDDSSAPVVTSNNNSNQSETQKPVEEEPAVETNYTIEKGTQYAFMSDEWNVYIATAVSDSIIKIEAWDKTMSSSKKMSLDSELGSYKINDPENGFEWIDDEHTAFSFVFSDKNNSRVKKPAAHVFTINISDTDVCKGTDYDKDIACYSYTNDDWHMYRAIPLTEHLIKIECWARTSSLDKYLFGWDWCVVDPDNNNMDFEWTDDEHTSFTVTTKDPDNKSYWKNDEFVLFELENPKFKYASVRDFLDGNKVGADKKEEVASSPEETQKPTETKVEETKAPEKEEPKTVSYSTNTEDTVKNGNSGVYAYKKSGSYDLYYIIDFDEGYVYWFSEGNGEESCDRLKIESGDLNDVLIITYHDGGDEWSYGLHFKYVNQPDHLILEDNDHFEYDYYTTNLSDALKLRDKKKMHDY